MGKNKKPYFNTKERQIIQFLHKRGAMTANEISEATGIAYVTVNKYLSKLWKDGVVHPNRKKWQEKEE